MHLFLRKNLKKMDRNNENGEEPDPNDVKDDVDYICTYS